MVVLVLGFAYLAPVVYVPAVMPSNCSLECAAGGTAQHYVSVSYRLIGQGAFYWPHGPYELVNTPIGNYDS
jgi:hypothetical protein